MKRVSSEEIMPESKLRIPKDKKKVSFVRLLYSGSLLYFCAIIVWGLNLCIMFTPKYTKAPTEQIIMAKVMIFPNKVL